MKAEWTNKDSLSIDTTGQNSKAILVIDIPNDVAEAYEYFTVDYDLRGISKEDRMVNESIKYVEDCSLRPLPKYLNPDMYSDTYGYGWNDCLKKITGEKE